MASVAWAKPRLRDRRCKNGRCDWPRHMIEGKKPSLFEDLRFLLIGPLFVLGLSYRRWHIPY
ncbi:hypothetical protein D5047_09935 [Verminephrobacter eiseniae]|nr:hypothetical protein [Verminephrobacter eiseniae]